MADTGGILSPDAARRTQAAVLWVENNSGSKPRRPPPRRGDPMRPPIRAILLEDLETDGSADCAVTERVESPEIQEVSIVGYASGGTFKLAFKGQTTSALAFNATAADMQAALENLSTIGQGNVSVTLGKIAATDSSPAEFPGVWLVEFQGTLADVDVPLLVATNSVQGIAVVVTATTHWADTGLVETINDVVPVESPTPMRAGAVVVGLWFPGVGYGCIACECREFSVTYY
jgi:hypothetical protein